MTLTNRDWDTVAREASGTTLDAALAAHTLEATRDIKKWEHALLQEQLAVLEGRGVDAWLETAKRGLGLFLCLDSAGRLIVSGVESPSSASEPLTSSPYGSRHACAHCPRLADRPPVLARPAHASWLRARD